MTFDEFYTIMELDRKKSAWSSKQSIVDRLPHLEGEVNELREAIESGNLDHASEELMDIILDSFFLLVQFEEQGYDRKKLLTGVIEKYKRRKPWVFTDEIVDADEEMRRWNEAKSKEKQ